jgi:hypothetical protein
MMKWIITEGRVGSYASESGDRAARTKQREGRVAVEKITRVLPKLMGRLKPVTSPASRCFLVALFILGFTTSYFANPPSKTLPQNPAGFDVEYHPPKPAIVLVHRAFAERIGLGRGGSAAGARRLRSDGRPVSVYLFYR